MANLTETPQWEPAIYEVATTDPVHGGPPNAASKQGIPNIANQQLANRTQWLKAEAEALGQDLSALTDGAPDGLNTFAEIAASLGGDADFAGTIDARFNAIAPVTDYSTNGYAVLAGGLILQWGEATQGADGLTRVTFPIAFPNAPRFVTGIHMGSGPAVTLEYRNSIGRTGVIFSQQLPNETTSTWPMRWMALGH